MVNNLGFAFFLAFGIAWLNRAYNLLEQILNSEKVKLGTFIVFSISFLFLIIVYYIVNNIP